MEHDWFSTKYELREDKVEEFLAALREWGLFQVTPEGLDYFFKRKEEGGVV